MKSPVVHVPLEENVEGLLCYLLGWISGIVFLLIENKSKFVRFHAWQSTFAFLLLTAAHFVVGWMPFIGGVLSFGLGIITLVLWIFMMYKAYNREMYKLPIAGDFAEKQSGK